MSYSLSLSFILWLKTPLDPITIFVIFILNTVLMLGYMRITEDGEARVAHHLREEGVHAVPSPVVARGVLHGAHAGLGGPVEIGVVGHAQRLCGEDVILSQLAFAAGSRDMKRTFNAVP